MARNMNTSGQFLPMPTPPWKTNSPAVVNNNFPIPPRNSTNFEWNNTAATTAKNIGPTSGFGLTAYRIGNQAGFSDNVSGNDFNRNDGNNYNNPGQGNSFNNTESPIGFGGQRGNLSGGFNNDIFNSNNMNSNIPDRNGPADNNFDQGNFDNRGRTDNFDRGNNFNRGNDYSSSRVSNSNNLESSPLLPWKTQNESLRNSPIDNFVNSANNNSFNNDGNYRQDRTRSPEKNNQDFNRRRSTRNGDNSRNQSKPISNQSKPISNQSTKPPLKNPVQEGDLELEKKALRGEVTEEFFNKIKPLSLMQVAADVALRYARKEFYLNKGNNQKMPEKPVGTGQYTCKTCYMNFLTKEKLNTHNNGIQHKEMDDLFQIKKEQARLIMQKRILGPLKPQLEMTEISKAEAENNLKPKEMELDVYILGIYESVMKPYWPLPNSKFYCRVCNYAEFNSESELKRHNLTVDHKRREATYEEAFCLYCQQHYFDKSSLEKHELTEQHTKIKDLMERTKESAVEHWHKVNNLDVPEKFGVSKPVESKDVATPKVGSKRTADSDANKSPIKKPSSKSDVSKTSDSKRSDKADTRPNDKKSNNDKKPNKSDTKSDSKESRDKKEEPKKSDTKTTSKSDTKSLKSDSKTKADSSKQSSKSDPKSTSKSDLKSDSKTESKTDKPDSKDKDAVWFAPIKGFMCIACHDFIVDEAGQKTHAIESKHIENVAKLKKLITQ